MIMKNDHAAVTKLKRNVAAVAPVGDAVLTDQTAEMSHAATIIVPMLPKNTDAHQPGNCPTLPCEI